MGSLRSSHRVSAAIPRILGTPLYPSSAILIILLIVPTIAAQDLPKQDGTKSVLEILQEHYDAARTFQLSGDQKHAEPEYTQFLAEALRISAEASVGFGQLDKAAALFEDSLRLSPEDPQTRLEYAQLRFQEEKLVEARSMAEKVLGSLPNNAQAHSLLGQILFAQEDFKGAREHLEQAVVAAPGFDIGYLLAITYIKLN